MSKKITSPSHRHLILEDGSIYTGEALGASRESYGEVVFNTSMTGYQEMLTDPSYAGQIVVPTYPLIGNYGVNRTDTESAGIQVAGFVVRDACTQPSHRENEGTLDDYLRSENIPGIAGVDTRAITRHIRMSGTMMGILSESEPNKALSRLRSLPRYVDTDFVSAVSGSSTYTWEGVPDNTRQSLHRIVVIDCGLKFNILRILKQRGCHVLVCPSNTSIEDILSMKPSGLVFSPGPGDPAHATYPTEIARGLMGKIPMMGICLGHQVIARALGGATFKLKFGHRGGNHPVQELATGRVYITAQNHGYAVDSQSLPQDVQVSHVNLNDNTVEGLRHRNFPILTIQYHSEASPGPQDSEYLFDQFLEMVSGASI